MKRIKTYLKLLRCKHYIKNFLIFLPLIFSKRFFDISLLGNALLAFFAFSFLSSSVYIINDIRDVAKDRAHPTKCKRPIASGEVKKGTAVVLTVVMLVLSVAVNFFICGSNPMSWIVTGVYFLLNLGYSFGLKNIPILDVTILASGFLLRLIYGSIVTDIELSTWFYLTTILASFYLGFGKRRNEYKIESTEKREVLGHYNYNYLDKNMHMCMTLALVFYSLWTIDISSSGNSNIIWTVPCLLLIVLKYSFNIERDSDGDPTEVILKDKILLAMIAAYALIMFGVLYL